MSKSRRAAATRIAESCSFCPPAAQIDQLYVATRAKSSRFKAAAVTGDVQTLFEPMYRRNQAGLPPAYLMVGHRVLAPHAALSAEFCS